MYTQIKALAQEFTNVICTLPHDVTELAEGLRLEFFEKKSIDDVQKIISLAMVRILNIVGAVGKLRSKASNVVRMIFAISDRKVSKYRSEDMDFSDIRVSDFLHL